MVIEYKELTIKLINKSYRNQATKRDLNKIKKLNEWYLTTLPKA